VKTGTEQNRRAGFTLVELLVVMAIIALLVGILVPTVNKAREAAKKTRCRANLHSIGQAIRGYMEEFHGYYPPMATKPSLEQQLHPDNPRPAMAEILGEYVSHQKEVFHCPSDEIRNPGDPKPPISVTSYFQWEGSSYEPMLELSHVTGEKWELSRENRVRVPVEVLFGEISSEIALMYEYEPFHYPPNTEKTTRMTLFADFHVNME